MEGRKYSLLETMGTIISVGTVWGILEATIGYFIHLLPISVGFLIWFPMATFFLMLSYQLTGRKDAIMLTAVLASAVKLLNLLLPGPIDRVINPSVSILFEGIAVLAACYLMDSFRFFHKPIGKLVASVAMNSIWRVLFLGYLLFLVPNWMKEVSVLQSSEKLLRFAVVDNLCSSMVVWAGMLLGNGVKFQSRKPMEWLHRQHRFVRIAATMVLIAINVMLQIK